MSDWTKRNARALLEEFQAHGLATGLHIRDFRGEDLRGQVFAAADSLAGADFRDADLTDAQFAGGVDLTGADLSNCRLVGARLDRATLTGADLTGARLDYASLIGADLRDATLDGTTWHRARLAGARLPDDALLDGWGVARPSSQPRLEISPNLGSVADLAWHPSGELLAVAREAGVEIWDLRSSTTLATLKGHTDWVYAVAWSPDGTHLATAGDDRVARIWDPTTGTTLATLTGHTGPVQAVAWSPDGTHLATAGTDGMREWSVGERRRPRWWWRILPRRLHEGLVATTRIDAEHIVTAGAGLSAASFSPDGTAVALGLDDGSVAVWSTTAPADSPTVRLLALPDSGWAAFYGEHRYRLEGDPAGRFWWRSGLCRFEPGELDGYGVERI
jgi:hypothetical protein